MTDKLPDEVKEGWYKQIPLRRGGTPEDVANVVKMFVCGNMSYTTGQVIYVDGGFINIRSI